MNTKTISDSDQIKEAYADAWEKQDNWNSAVARRNLKFRSSQWYTPDEFYAIMRQAIPQGYNEYNTDRVYGVFANGLSDIEIQIARESSPCLYIRGNSDTLKKLQRNKQLRANEADIESGILRLWWD